MKESLFHMLLNHLPVFGSLLGSIILVWGIVRKETSIIHLASWLLLIMSLLTFPVYVTGNSIKKLLLPLSDVSEALISVHEETSLAALIFQSITGFFAALYLRFKQTWPSMLQLYTVAAAVSGVLISYAGFTGEQIRHKEIHNRKPHDLQNVIQPMSESPVIYYYDSQNH
jgi:hypothetical protein